MEPAELKSIFKCFAFLLLWLIPTTVGVLLFASFTWHVRPDNCKSVFVGMFLMLLGCRLARHYSTYGPLFLVYGFIGSLLFVPLYSPYASFIGDDSNGYWIAYIALCIVFCLGCRYVAMFDFQKENLSIVGKKVGEPTNGREDPVGLK
ncbi:MAG: hypothetical protein AAGI63_09100 [Planctomycetota bacterium]